MPLVNGQPELQNLQAFREVVHQVASFTQPWMPPFTDGPTVVRFHLGLEVIGEVTNSGHGWHFREVTNDGPSPHWHLLADHECSPLQAAMGVVQQLIVRLCAVVQNVELPLKDRSYAAGLLQSIMTRLEESFG
ncbi:hypothetical protein ABZ342_39055 [Amycolatopsis sp. NPDC005961]|uniref:hypothetical protein n=1 Tax=Amycolatopsis sp. NPDC005961 TaxID=3156720 RepID=UPI00340AD2BE